MSSKTFFIFVVSFIFATQACAVEIPLNKQRGVYTLPVRINSVVTLNFVLDSGAADVFVPADVVMTLLKTGSIKESDFLPGQAYLLADGSVLKSPRFLIRELALGGIKISNVPASISPLGGVLGQSLLERLDSWKLDNERHVLIVDATQGRSHDNSLETHSTSPNLTSPLQPQARARSGDTDSERKQGDGNFDNFETTIKKSGFTPTGTLNEFKLYEKPSISITMRNCGGYCCEGMIMSKPISDKELAGNVLLVYFQLQNTLRAHDEHYGDLADTAGRIRILVAQVLNNLKHADRTEFTFDHLNVRGQYDPLSQKEIIIKLWVP
jgi:hypothetical protein